MANVIIRKATNADFQTINQLFDQLISYLNEQKRKNKVIVNDPEFATGYEDDYLEKFLSDTNRMVYVAEVDNQVLSYLSCVMFPDESYIYIDDFCTDKLHRGQGLGSMLLKTIEDFAANNNYAELRLNVEVNNIEALEYYNEMGFVPDDITDMRISMTKKIREKDIKRG